MDREQKKTTRFTNSEIKSFQESADKLGMNFSKFIRRACHFLNDARVYLETGKAHKNSEIVWEILKNDKDHFPSLPTKPNKENKK